MAKNQRIAHLSWLRPPIQKGVDVSKVSLDTYHQKIKELSSPPADAQRPWFDKQESIKNEAFNTLAREVTLIHSSLSVVGCIGGAALALEIKIILNTIRLEQMDDSKIEPALLSVLSGLLMIPNYIKMVVDGAPDSAGILSKPINELREMRSVPVLEEDNILPPDIEFVFVDPPLKDRECIQSKRNDVFSRSPKRFREAFSSYIANHSKPALAEIKATLRELQEVTNDPEVGCFWWVGECLADALDSGAIRSAGNTLSQIRMLSVAIQRAETEGEEGAKQTLGITRFKSLLSVLSMSTKLSQEIVDTLAVFNVRKTVDFGSLALLQSRIESSHATTLADISSELKPLLETAMVSLGRARSSKNLDVFDTQFETYRTAMRHVTSVFYMVNENELAGIATKALARVEHVNSPAGLDNTVIIENLLSDILFLDDRIDGLDTNDAIQALKIQGVKPDIVSSVISEGLTELARTRKLITQHVDSGTGAGDLQAGLQSLQQASSALAFIGAEQISTLLNGACQAFINLLDQGAIKSSPRLALAARAMVAIEIYMTSIKDNLEPSPDLLMKAEQALSELGIQIEHVDTVNKSDLIQKFEAGTGQVLEEENPFLDEISELRLNLQSCLTFPKIRDRESMNGLFKSADRLSIASKMYGFDSFSRIARALATYADKVTDLSSADAFDLVEAKTLLIQGIEMCIRCMDEYSARGKVALFTRDLETTLLERADPVLAKVLDEQAQEIETESTAVTQEGDLVLEGELDYDIPERSIPDTFDAGLIALFRDEFELYHALLLAFSTSGQSEVTREICRAAHTIHGISGSAGCAVLHEIFGIVEARLELLLAKAKPMTQVDLDNLHLLLVEFREFEQDFPWVVETQLFENWVEIASMLGDGSAQVEFEVMKCQDPVHLEIEADSAVEPSDRSKANVTAEKFSHAETFEAAKPVHEQESAPSLTAVLDREYSDEMAEFYIEEADDILPDLQGNVSSWLVDMHDAELVATIKRQMHTLKGAAMMAQANSIGTITHAMESLFESISLNIIEPNHECAELVRLVLNTIHHMTSAMRQGIAYEAPTALIKCLQYAVDSNQIDLSYVYGALPSEEANTQNQSAELSGSPEFTGMAESTGDQLAPGDEGKEETTADAQASFRKRSRGGRGKGGAKRQSILTEHVDKADHVEVMEVALKIESSGVTPPEVTIVQPAIAPEKILPAELLVNAIDDSKEITDRNNEFVLQATEDFDRLYSIDGIDTARIYQQVQSRAVLDMLNRSLEPVAVDSRKRAVGTTEKMKVDLKLLENAGESASELTAVRHRLDALNEDQILGITAIREMLEVHSLQHGQFTTALRGYFNQQPTARTSSSITDDAHLERFTDLSAMHVALGAQIDEVLGAVVEVFGFGLQKRNALRDQGQLIGGLQRDLLDSRLVPFINVKPKLTMAIQQASNDTKKIVNANFIGSEVIMDKMIQDNIAEPLTHILRNAIDHGIETESERVLLGKPPAGNIEITVYRRAKNVVIAVKDDGRGIDISAVRKKAVEKRIISDNDELSDKEIMRLITNSGFSTAKVVTNVSGRGVGMDIVAAAVDNLGGQLIIDSEYGKGTTFTVELPFTIGSNRAMMCSSGSQWFAIPSYFMTQVIMTNTSVINRQRAQVGHATVEYEGVLFEIVNLADLIAMPDLRTASDRISDSTLILCEQGDMRFAIEVEKVESMPEIHIRKLEGILSHVRGIVGETEKQDGTPVFVLDVMELARLNLKLGTNGYQVRQNRVRSVKRDQKPIVLVVDDSRQYRTLLDRYFTERGYIVVTARDGQDALHQLPLERMPDLMVVDVEMPRMNGFEFTEAIRRQKEYDKVPIIMITTRTGLEEKAYQAGVDVYVNKPCNDETLDQAVSKVKPQNTNNEVAA